MGATDAEKSVSYLPLKRQLPLLAQAFVPIFGIPSLVVALALFAAVNPDYYSHDIPSISRTISIPPASTIFVAFMTPTVISIVVCWIYGGRMNLWRVRVMKAAGKSFFWLGVLSVLAATLGIVAGLSLFALAVVTLDCCLTGHMVFSYLFFVSQILAFIVDTAFTLLIARSETNALVHVPAVRRALKYKTRFCAGIVGAGICYYLLYLLKDFELGPLQMLVQVTYVMNEYALCTMLFSYSLFYLPLSTRYSRKMAQKKEIALAVGTREKLHAR